MKKDNEFMKKEVERYKELVSKSKVTNKTVEIIREKYPYGLSA